VEDKTILQHVVVTAAGPAIRFGTMFNFCLRIYKEGKAMPREHS